MAEHARIVVDAGRRHGLRLQALADSAVWLVAVPLAVSLRFDFDPPAGSVGAALLTGLGGAIVFAVAGRLCGVNRGRFRYGSYDELASLCVADLLVLVALLCSDLLQPGRRYLPLSAPIVAAVLACAGQVACRYSARLVRTMLIDRIRTAEPVLIYGAGDAGSQLALSMLAHAQGLYRPVGFVDDDPARARYSAGGVRVLGRGEQLAELAYARGVERVVLAMPSAPGTVIRRIVEQAEAAGLRVSTLPSLRDLDSLQIDAAQVRAVTEADLLGRAQVRTDVASAAPYIRGRRVLVTGAGGSIGSELCRQLRAFEPAELVMVDRDESALHAVQLSIEGRALLDTPDLVVADIRDEERVREIFERHRPEVVFHAAALKHLPLLEAHPTEGIKTNVWGTRHVLDAARDFGTTHFVNVSTDKAADPTSVLGYTKLLAERLTSFTAERSASPRADVPRVFLSVRFGNVLGSRGSVVPAFRAMIEAGGPLTVTHPEVTRYFMTIPEAVELVIQAGALGANGETLILDMGEPVLIVDVARRMIAASGRDIAIEFTGLRPGEKLHEDLVSVAETTERPHHPLISHTAVAPIDPAAVAALRTVADLRDCLGEKARIPQPAAD